jgi:hypothetical protein
MERPFYKLSVIPRLGQRDVEVKSMDGKLPSRMQCIVAPLSRCMVAGMWFLVLLVFLVSAIIWARSYQVTDYWFWVSVWPNAELVTTEGSLYYYDDALVCPNEYAQRPPDGFSHLSERPAVDSAQLDMIPFDQVAVGPGRLMPIAAVWLPYGLILAGRVVWWAGRRIRQRRRRTRGLCLQCGYDLRASPERCPECGIPPSKANNP